MNLWKMTNSSIVMQIGDLNLQSGCTNLSSPKALSSTAIIPWLSLPLSFFPSLTFSLSALWWCSKETLTLILNFLASRTLNNKSLSFINQSVSQVLAIRDGPIHPLSPLVLFCHLLISTTDSRIPWKLTYGSPLMTWATTL